MSQKVSDVHLKFFLFHGKAMLHSQDIQFFVSLTILLTPKFCDIRMSIGT